MNTADRSINQYSFSESWLDSLEIWTEEPGGLQSRVRKESDITEQLTLSHSSKALKLGLQFDSAIPLLVIHLIKINMGGSKDLSMRIFNQYGYNG